MATKITTSIATPQWDYNGSDARIGTGTRVDLDDGGEAVFCQAVSEVAQYAAVAISSTNTVTNLTTANTTQGSGTTNRVGFAQTSIASGNYGWFQVSGRPVVNVLANCQDNVMLYTTSTAGALDDVTVSAAMVVGIHALTSVTTASAVTCIVASQAFVMPWVNPA